jgi:hypothetical protein
MKKRVLAQRFAAGLAALVVGGGLAVAVGGVAQASVPNYWGFALVTSPSGTVNATHWAESVAAPTPTVTATGPGVEVVRFRNIGFFKGGVVHVTAVTDQYAWCQAQGWRPLGGSEYVTVRCFVKAGTPMFVPFTVMVSESSGTLPGGLAYAYVYYKANVQSSFNSKGQQNVVSPVSTGVWLVRLPGPGPATPSGGVQVTAVNTKPRICDIASRTQTATQQVIRVQCYTPLGAPAATGWTLSYQRGRAITGAKPGHFAYTVNNKPLLAGPYAPAPTAVNFNSAAGVNTVRRAGTGLSLVTFPRVGVLPNTVLVSAVATVPRVCNLNTTWATSAGAVIVRDVTCFTTTGVPTATKSFISYTAKA